MELNVIDMKQAGLSAAIARLEMVAIVTTSLTPKMNQLLRRTTESMTNFLEYDEISGPK